MASGYKWHPIEDLPENWRELSTGELDSLLQVWNDQRADMEASGVLASFNEKLQRRWAIETGIIERVYSLDRGTTELLLSHGIDATLIPRSPTEKDPIIVAQIIQDHLDALEGLFAFVKSERPLSTSYIKELHAALLRHSRTTVVQDQFGNPMEVDIELGAYKKLPNNPRRPDGETHEYCPPEHVASEMDRLVEMHLEHEKAGIPVEIRSAWLHHRFTQIHPFTDGNGRVARALASLLFLKSGWFPVVLDRDARSAYIDALELADYGNLGPLVDLFVRNELQSYVELLNVRDEATVPGSVEDVIASAREVLTHKQRTSGRLLETVHVLADDLRASANSRIAQVRTSLYEELSTIPGFTPHITILNGLRMSVIRTAAEALGYPLTAFTAPRVIGFEVQNPGNVTIGVVFAQIGSAFHGVMGVMAFVAGGSWSEPTADLFQFNYRDNSQHLQERFGKWLEPALANALKEWRKRIG